MQSPRFAALLLLVGAWGCGGAATTPTSPTPSERPTPAPQPAMFSLVGTVAEASPTTIPGLSGARIEVADGPYSGQIATSDNAGAFRIDGISGPLTIRVSRDGYEPGSQRVDVIQNRTVSVALMPNRQDLEYTLTGTLTPADSTCSDGSYQKPCAIVALPVHYEGLLEADLDWTPGPGSMDVDLSLWKGAMYIAGSSQMLKQEHLQYILNAGTMYELHITYYSGSMPAQYTLRIRRPN